MVSEWKDAKLGDYIDSCLGKMLDKNKNTGEFHPYLGNSNVRWGAFELDELSEMKFESHEHERYGIKKGDLIVCEGGEPGRCAIWNEDVPDMKIQKALHRVRTLAGLDGDYLYYWFLFSARAGHIDPYFTGTTIKHLTGKALKELPIKIPPMRYQQEAAKLLRGFDNKITLNRQINQTLEQMAQTLFKSWFVDFDPVMDNALDAGNPIPDELQHRAEARKAVRESEGFKPLPDDVRQLFPDAFEESELGWVPKGWDVTALGNLVTVKRGGSPRPIKDFIVPEGLPWVKISDATSSACRFLSETKEFIREEGLKKTVYLKSGSLILSNSATPGLPKFLDLDACIHDGWLYFPHKEKLSDKYLYQLFEEIRPALVRMGNGSVFTNLKTDILKAHQLLVASENVLTYFDDQLANLHKKIHSVEQESRTLTKLRDTLLPKLISGELRLDEIEAAVE
ncbi:restriction endonuclease subunit S [Vibrio cholerae]